MNKENYKEIAEIIKSSILWNHDRAWNKTTMHSIDIKLIERLTDYFEKEEWLNGKCKYCGHRLISQDCLSKKCKTCDCENHIGRFNKQQFLKWAEVEK